MSPQPIQYSGAALDLSPRVFKSVTVAASPAAATETIICTLTVDQDLAVTEGAFLNGCCAFTVGTNGTDITLKLRRTDTSGTTLISSGLINAPAAADLLTYSLSWFDTGPTVPGQVYVMTLTVANGSAPSTVSAASLFCLLI